MVNIKHNKEISRKWVALMKHNYDTNKKGDIIIIGNVDICLSRHTWKITLSKRNKEPNVFSILMTQLETKGKFL